MNVWWIVDNTTQAIVDALKSIDVARLSITENVLLKEVEWLRIDFAKFIKETEPTEEQIIQNCYTAQAIEHFKFVLAYFDAKYDKL